jgi:iron(III) transport system substrate-binding protein
MVATFVRYGIGALLALGGLQLLSAHAQIPAGYPANYADLIKQARKEGALRIYGTTDTNAVAPLIKDFQLQYPEIRIEYEDMNSTEVFNRFMSESRSSGKGAADILWSSAMDLQMKLVNDGYALTYKSPEAEQLPEWAIWRNEAFGTTYEPIVLVYNKRALAPAEVPQTHGDLIRLLKNGQDRFLGKIVTYDIERSGVGFLLATQDSKTYTSFWELARVMKELGLSQHAHTSSMMERIASGDAVLGYNLLGSYAIVRANRDPSVGYVLFHDYTLVMSRIMFIAKQAKHPNAARLWVDYVLSRRGQQIIASQSQLFSIRADVEGEATAAGLTRRLGHSLKPIVVGPGLLTYLDKRKRTEFIRRWQSGAQQRQ